jgi:hypothetical protein
MSLTNGGKVYNYPVYIHLTIHSAFSLQEGLMSPVDLVRLAKDHGISALGLTDHHLLTGTIEFVIACQEAGIQPVIGLEIDLEQSPLQLLATSLEGWSNLCRLSSALALRENHDAPCSLELLFPYSKDLIALSDNPQGLQEGFEGRLYVALRNLSNAGTLSTQARKLGLPTVVAHLVYYQNPDQARLQKTLAAIRLNQTVTSISQHAPVPADAWFMPPQLIEERFREYPEAVHATTEIAERCRFDLPFGKPQMPVVPLPEGVTVSQHLRDKATAGAIALYGEKLFNVLFRDAARTEFDALSKKTERTIVLVLESSDPSTSLRASLDGVAWEYAYNKAKEEYVVEDCAFVRPLPEKERPAKRTLTEVERVPLLFIPANPLVDLSGEPMRALNLEDEWREMKRHIEKSAAPFDMIELRPATPEALQSVMARFKNGMIAHFSGHGAATRDGAILLFERENGASNPLEAREFVREIKDKAWIGFLSACQSAVPERTEFSNLARELAKAGVPFALGMQFNLPDPLSVIVVKVKKSSE